ncbi:MAG: hypothetical protein WA947_04885 [Phormidesmis sp.]
MLIWKTQTLNVNMASVRYRCLLPLRYLSKQGIEQSIFGGADPVNVMPQTKAIVFVKSFRNQDVKTCERVHRLGVPIILDLCDNIFIENYAADNNYVPAKNFLLMAQQAAAIVTTGETLKGEVEKALAEPLSGSFAPRNIAVPIVVIPDGSETLSDIDYAFRNTRWQRLKSLVLRPTKNRLMKRLKQASGQLKKKKTKTVTKSEVQPTPLFPDKWPAASAGTQTILWFGNHGAKYGSFGMSNILDVAAAIEQLSQSRSLRLVVVSNSREKYEQYIAPLPFETLYLRWHPRSIYDYIRASDVVIIPNSQSTFSLCKSENRAVLSLSQGTPVVASRTPALDLFEDCVALDDWEAGLRQYLSDPEVAQTHVALAQQAIAQNLSGEKIAQKWLALLEQVTNRSDGREPNN